MTIVNVDEIPGDLAPGTYCCHLDEGSALWAMKVRMVIPPQLHDPKAACCLIQITKTDPEPVEG